MQMQIVSLVDYFAEPEQLLLVVIGPLDSPAHFRDHGAGHVARRGQLQPVCLGRTSEQDLGITRDRRSQEVCLSEVGFEPDRPITGRGFVTKAVEAVQFEDRPGRLDTV
jgi:hypothetical protein